MRKYSLLSLLLFCISAFLSCNKRGGNMEHFTYRFSMESVGNYKVEFQLNPDTTFAITQNNYFFDKFDGKNRSMEIDGILTDVEFNTFKELISESHIHKMKDSYGFDDDENLDNSIIYIIELTREGKSKYVVINASSNQNFSTDFTELVSYTNEFLNERLN